MFVEVNPLIAIKSANARMEADENIRQRFKHLYSSRPSSIIGISALGPLVCCYRFDRETGLIKPTYNDAPPSQDSWNVDVTTQRGGAQIEYIFKEVKSIVLEASPETEFAQKEPSIQP